MYAIRSYYARERGLEQVLVTCAADNTGSARVIERNGGALESRSHSERAGHVVKRYWIDLSRPGAVG